MRRSGLAAVIISSLLVVACSEQPTAPTDRTTPPGGGPAFTAVCTSPTTSCIQNLINALFPKGDLLKSANSLWANIQTKVNQGPKGLAQAQAKAMELVAFGLKNFYAGKLIGGMEEDTQDNLIALAAAVFQYTGLSSVPPIPEGGLGADGAAVIITPQSPTTLVITGTKEAGFSVPAGAAPTTVLVTISPLPNSPGPLRTSLDQYPRFYHFASSPDVTFNLALTGSICQSQDFEPFGDLRLAHNVSPFGWGDVEILPLGSASLVPLDCPEPVGTLEHGGLIGLASAGWSFLGRTVGPLATAILLPDELHAGTLETCCLTGTFKKFSEFGAVDPGSNPASLNYNPDEATFSDLSAAPGGTVTPAPSVKVTSQNGSPIANVPVLFAVGEAGGTVNGGSTATVNTNSNGIATVTSWILGEEPGTYTLTATPLAVAQVGSPGTPPYKPAAAFAPTSLTFTATATTVTPVSSSLQLIASSNAGGVLVEDTDAPSQGATLNQLSATVNAFAENAEMSVLTKGSAVATWQSGGAGQIIFTDIGWTTVGAQDPSHAYMYGGTDWTYTFTANESGTFSLDYDNTLDPATTNDFGLNGFAFSWAQGAGELQQEAFFSPTAEGTLTKSVVAGTTYTARLENWANISGPLGSRTAYMSGTFNWSVTPTPIILLSQSVRSSSGVVAPLATTQLQCEGTQRRVCTRRYQGRQPGNVTSNGFNLKQTK
jgi:hypothetical protein